MVARVRRARNGKFGGSGFKLESLGNGWQRPDSRGYPAVFLHAYGVDSVLWESSPQIGECVEGKKPYWSRPHGMRFERHKV